MSDIIDIPKLKKLLDSLHNATGFMCSVVNNDFTVATEAGWQEICYFHIRRPDTQICQENIVAAFNSDTSAPYLIHKHPNGLYDCACTIKAGDEHLGTLFTGWFLLEPPDEGFFRQQAYSCGFPEAEYIAALRKVPVVNIQEIRKLMQLYAQLVDMLIDLGLNRFEQRGMLTFLQQLMDAIPNPIFYKDNAGIYLGCNKAFEKFSRHRKRSIIGRSAHDLFPENIVRIYLETDNALHREPGVQQYEYHLEDPDGGMRNVFTNKAAFFDAFGKVAGVVGVVTDVTDIKTMEKALKENEAKYRALFNHSLSGITYFSVIHGPCGQPVDYEVLEVNGAFERLTGIKQKDVVGRRASDTILDAELNGNWRSILLDAVLKGEPKTFEYFSPIFQKWLLVSAFSPQPGSLAIVFADINEQKSKEQQAKHAAEHDALTGLPNRRLLEERLNAAVARAREQNEIVAVIFLDLDDFKIVNDLHGHSEGDRLLQEVAQRIKECTRKDDFASRFGGDEFVLVFPGLKHHKEAKAIEKRITTAFDKPLNIRGEQLSLSASIGISYFPQDGDDAFSLTHSADAAMYSSKKTSRNHSRHMTIKDNPPSCRNKIRLQDTN